MEEYSIEKLEQIVKEFCEEREWDQYHTPKDLAIGMSTEANELLDLFRFKSDQEIQEMFQDKEKLNRICEELSDVFYFVLRFAQKNNINLSEALENKIKHNKQKYPVEKFKGKNIKYDELK